MESGRSWTPPSASPETPPTSRRARRDEGSTSAKRGASSARAARSTGSAAAFGSWLPRTAILAALAVATIGVPVAAELDGRQTPLESTTSVARAGLPTAFEVLTGTAADGTPTSLLAAVPGTVRMVNSASRTLARSPLPECTEDAAYSSSNGYLASSELCTLWDGRHKLRADAAMALAELNLTFRAAFGRDMCLDSAYRSYSEQASIRSRRGGMAAPAGKSNHGWGLAIDLCKVDQSRTVLGWLADNGPTYGWENPPWAKSRSQYEPWHWEYLPGTIEMGTDYRD